MKSQILSKELRAFTHCSKYRALGGVVELNEWTDVLDLAFTTFCFEWLRGNRSEDMIFDLSRRVSRSITYRGLRQTRSPYEIDSLQRKVTLDLSELQEKLTELDLDLVDAAFAMPVQIRTSTMDLIVNALYKQPSTNLHAVYFTPYASVFDIKNDPIHTLNKLAWIKFYQGLSMTPRAGNGSLPKHMTLHYVYSSAEAFSITPLTFETTENAAELNRLSDLISLYETGAGYPLVPCKFTNCVFRDNCYPFGES